MNAKSFPNNWPLGTFFIDNELLSLSNWKRVQPLMSKVVVVQARWRFDLSQTEYLAFSDLFDPIPQGSEAPVYEIIFQGDQVLAKRR